MLNVDVMPTMLAEALKQTVSLLRGNERVDEFHLPAGEVIVLDVNQKQDGAHKYPLNQ
jgi:hypothetical protein